MTTLAPSKSKTGHPGARNILVRLRKGYGWLTEQHRLWLKDDPMAVSDEVFSAALIGWDGMERIFRCSGYEGCIWGTNNLCVADAPIVCDACVGSAGQPVMGSII